MQFKVKTLIYIGRNLSVNCLQRGGGCGGGPRGGRKVYLSPLSPWGKLPTDGPPVPTSRIYLYAYGKQRKRVDERATDQGRCHHVYRALTGTPSMGNMQTPSAYGPGIYFRKNV